MGLSGKKAMKTVSTSSVDGRVGPEADNLRCVMV